MKEELIKEAKSHRKADRFIQGEWIDEKIKGKYSGCFMGCMTQTKDNSIEKFSEISGLPLWLCYVAEKIFEGLPQEEAVEFPVQFLEAWTIDNNWEQVFKDWNIIVLTDQLRFVDKDSEQEKAIQQCIALFKMETIIESARSASWSSARSAAKSASWSAARSAAESAAESARSAAESALWSARSASWSAAESARSAAESVSWSVRSAAESAHYKWLRDKLLKII